MKEWTLICTNCGKIHKMERANSRCVACREPLELPIIEHGTINTSGKTMMERYLDFFPYFKEHEFISLGEGNTGMVAYNHIAEEIGFEKDTLLIKNETQNPTWSFKDRGTSVAVNFARTQGWTKVGTCSAGNMASSVAAYGAAMGMKSYIFVPEHILPEKIKPVTIYGAKVFKVIGAYNELYDNSAEYSKMFNIYFANSDVPMRIEGYKTMAFEICEQSDFNPPEWVLLPSSSGGLCRGLEKGFLEFQKAGLIKKVPNIVAVQAEGSSPVGKAFAEGADHITNFGEPYTIAHGISNPYPPSGNQQLRLVKAGRIRYIDIVPETEILATQELMGRGGIFVQPASGVPIASAKHLREIGMIKPGERVVTIATGSGLKATSVVRQPENSVFEVKLDEIEGVLKKLES